MNYRHAFHAGNFADVLKHVVLALCLDRLGQKDKPYRVIDTHAGIGLYDLGSEEAGRSPEWRDGVARVLAAVDAAPEGVREALAPWIAAINACNPGGGLDVYPGSPCLAQALMRPEDSLRLCELHPEDVLTLRRNMGRDGRVKIEARNGYEALAAYLPPPERRGVVLVDPPFEAGSADRKADFADMVSAIYKGVSRWPNGVYILWRPLKDIDQVEAFEGDLATVLIEEAGLEPDRLLAADIWVRDIGTPGPLAGAGVIVINPPFGLREHLERLLPWLTDLLAQGPGAGFRLADAGPSDPDDDPADIEEDMNDDVGLPFDPGAD